MAKPDEDAPVINVVDTGAKATESDLAALHGVVASYLKEVIMTGQASPAVLGAAITFLKNNSITADPATNAAIADLKQVLKDRRNRKGGLTQQGAAEAEEKFAQIMGMQMPGMQ